MVRYSEADIARVESLVSLIQRHDDVSRCVAKKHDARLGWVLVGVVFVVDLPDVFTLLWGVVLVSVLYMSLRSERQAQKVSAGYQGELATYGVMYTTGKFVAIKHLSDVVRLDVLAERLRLANRVA